MPAPKIGARKTGSQKKDGPSQKSRVDVPPHVQRLQKLVSKF